VKKQLKGTTKRLASLDKKKNGKGKTDELG
jgi:hypothetical protein